MTDIQAATESIVAATSHPVSVQLINQGAGIWGNVATGLITGLLTGGITLTGIWLTHYFTLKRERQASEDKMKKELHYIATEGTVAKLAMRQPFVLFKGLTFQKLCL
ncbi:hypothetical protein P2S51_28070, partial [Escherichia coli]